MKSVWQSLMGRLVYGWMSAGIYDNATTEVFEARCSTAWWTFETGLLCIATECLVEVLEALT